MSTHAYEVLRVVNFFIIFVAFVIILSKALWKLSLAPEDFRWERAMNGIWCLGTVIATGGAIYSHTPGTWRLWIFTVIGVAQIVVAVFSFRVHEETGYNQ